MIGAVHSIASFCVDLLLQIDSNTEVLAMDLLFSENAQLHFTTLVFLTAPFIISSDSSGAFLAL